MFAIRERYSTSYLIGLLVFFFLIFFRAAPMAYGGSQARGPVGAMAAGLHHSNSGIRATFSTYTIAHGNVRS